MKRHARQALVCSVAAYALACGALFAWLGAPASADGAAETLGRLFALTALSGVLCGWIVARSPHAWSWLKFAGMYALTAIALLALSAYGHAAEPCDDCAPHDEAPQHEEITRSAAIVRREPRNAAPAASIK